MRLIMLAAPVFSACGTNTDDYHPSPTGNGTPSGDQFVAGDNRSHGDNGQPGDPVVVGDPGGGDDFLAGDPFPGDNGSHGDNGQPGDPVVVGDPGDRDDFLAGDPFSGDSDATTVIPLSLVVVSNGNRLGYLQHASENTLSIWDDVRNVIYQINDTTGFVAGCPSMPYFESGDCTGSPYGNPVSNTACPAGVLGNPPARPHVVPDIDGFFYEHCHGFVEAPGLVTKGSAATVIPNSLLSPMNLQCSATNGSTVCAYQLIPYTGLPTSFALPIMIEEEQ